MEGAAFRQEEKLRLALLTARTTAVFVRWPRKRHLPTIESILKKEPLRVGPQTPAQQSRFLHEWARRGQARGLAISIGRLAEPEKPFRREPGNG